MPSTISPAVARRSIAVAARRRATVLLRGGCAIGALTAPVVLVSPAVAAPQGYGNALPGGGPVSEVSSARGALAWFTTPTGTTSSTQTTVHLDSPDVTNAVRVRTSRRLARMSLGTTVQGRLVVVAIAHDGEVPRSEGRLRNADAVQIDLADGRVTELPAGSRSSVEEQAVALDRGRVVLGRRADGGRGRAALYATTLGSSRLERLRSTSGLTRTGSANVTELAVAPADSARSTPTYGAITQERATTSFSELRLHVGRGTARPRRVARTVSSGTNLEGVLGLSWESPTRLWYVFGSEERPSGVRRYSTSTRHTSGAETATVADGTFTSTDRGIVAAAGRDDQATGTTRDRLYTTGRLTLRRIADD